MKKSATGKYLGHKKSGFLFEVDGRPCVFNKCDRHYVVKYDLLQNGSLNKLFTILYWQIDQKVELVDKDVLIITELYER